MIRCASRTSPCTAHRPPQTRFLSGKGTCTCPWGGARSPWSGSFGLLRGFQGTVIHEYRSQLFLPYAETAQEEARRLIGLLGQVT